ncbi:hypothetical protein ACH4FA_06310 [Streptomyces sp. NPDC017966]|uniref:hypothetical protein n=1 Tax=Streptomyces sp. NPDC017966 TaxID=3365023 RepID=UPI003789A09D
MQHTRARMQDAVRPTGKTPYLVDAALKAADADRPYEKPDPLESALLAAWNAGEPEEDTEQPTGTCPTYRDCVETGPHDHHFNHNMRVHSEDGELLLDAGMAAYEGDDDRPVIYLRGEDYNDAASVHAATAKLRQLLDEVDALADRVFTDHEGRA